MKLPIIKEEEPLTPLSHGSSKRLDHHQLSSPVSKSRKKLPLINSHLSISEATTNTNFTLKLTPNFQQPKIRSPSITTTKPLALKSTVSPETALSSSDNSRPRLTTMTAKPIKIAFQPGSSHSKSQLFSLSPRTRLKLSSDNNKTPLSCSEARKTTNLTS